MQVDDLSEAESRSPRFVLGIWKGQGAVMNATGFVLLHYLNHVLKF